MRLLFIVSMTDRGHSNIDWLVSSWWYFPSKSFSTSVTSFVIQIIVITWYNSFNWSDINQFTEDHFKLSITNLHGSTLSRDVSVYLWAGQLVGIAPNEKEQCYKTWSLFVTKCWSMSLFRKISKYCTKISTYALLGNNAGSNH